MESISIKEERISKEEYLEFLKRSDLGEQYPKSRFEERISKLVSSVSISLAARNERGQLIGVCFGITDYSYWLFITDLGVDRDYLRKGIGKALVFKALEIAGGADDIALYLVANEDATPFYEKIGLRRSYQVMEYNHIQWD